MTINVHTDNFVPGSEDLTASIQKQVTDQLKRFDNHITTFDVFLSDENASKHSSDDKRCVMQAQVKGLPPQAVTCHSDVMQKSVTGAIDKMKSTLSTVLEKQRDR